MVKNINVCEEFIKGNSKIKTKNLFIEKNCTNGVLILYSYGYHFPLSIKLTDGVFLVNSDKYSRTTARHKSNLMRNLKNPLMFNTNQLKKVLLKRVDKNNWIVL